MPTYQYRCTECADEIEVVQKFTDAALTECPACSGSLRKVFSAVGVVFKGSGFYATDNRPKGNSGARTAGAGTAAEGTKAGAPTSAGTTSAGAKPEPTRTAAPAATTAA